MIEDAREVGSQAELVDWTLDKSGRRHGHVLLDNKVNKLSLNELLIKQKFAGFSKLKLEADLREAEEAAAANSIRPVTQETEVQPETEAEANPSLEEVAAETVSKSNQPRRSFMDPAPQYKGTRTGKGRGRGKSLEKMAPLSSLVPIHSHDKDKETVVSDSKAQAQKLLAALRKSRDSRVVKEEKEEEEECIWDQIRRTRDTKRDDTRKVKVDILPKIWKKNRRFEKFLTEHEFPYLLTIYCSKRLLFHP